MAGRFIFFLLFFFGSILANAQENQEGKAEFPQSWTGKWKGTLKWYRTGSDSVQNVPMELRIAPTDSAGHFTFHLIYGAESKDSRPYIIKPGDNGKGHWILDENNGILIDHYWVARKLSCAFTVMNATIITNTWLEGETMIMEFYSLSASPVSTTGKNTEDSPTVKSYGVRGFQRAELRRN